MKDQVGFKIAFKGNNNSLKVQKNYFCNGTPVAIPQNPQGIAVNPKKPQVYVACGNGLGDAAYVSIIDTSNTNYAVNNVNVGNSISWPNEVAVSPDGKYAYVTLGGKNSVSVIDTAKGAVDTSVPLITVGREPWGIAVTPNGNTVYVANKRDSTVSVIDTTQIDPITNTYKVIQTMNSVNSASGFPISFGQFIGNYPIGNEMTPTKTTPIQTPTTNTLSQPSIQTPTTNTLSRSSSQTSSDNKESSNPPNTINPPSPDPLANSINSNKNFKSSESFPLTLTSLKEPESQWSQNPLIQLLIGIIATAVGGILVVHYTGLWEKLQAKKR